MHRPTVHNTVAPARQSLPEARSLWGNALVPELRPDFGSETALSEVLLCYQDVLAAQAEQLPEVGHNQAAILDAACDIVDSYEISPSLFDDDARSLVFTSIANRWATAESDQEQEPTRSEREKAFLVDALTLLAYEHSPVLVKAKPEIEKGDHVISGFRTRYVYDKYTDHQLSREMQAAIDNGLLEGVKARMGITPENEAPYEVRVLSIDPQGQNSRGLLPPIVKWEDLPADHEEKSEVLRQQAVLMASFKRRKETLVKNAERMSAELGKESVIAALAWATDLEGSDKRVMCIMEPLARKLLYPELTAHNTSYSGSLAERDLAIVEHEYVHVQEMVSVDGKNLIGIGYEELRAEHFSGNKMGYPEIKGFFNDIGLVTGFDAIATLEGRSKGGTAAEIYTDMAASIGLNGMLEVLLAAPETYRDADSSDFVRSVFDYIGGYDAVTERLISRELVKDGGGSMQTRIAEAAVKLKGDFYRWNSLRSLRGFNLVADLIGAKRQQLIKSGELVISQAST